MAIEGYGRSGFGEMLNSVVFPSQPIQTVEHLLGRATELARIDKALFAPGRHVFVYGDRGVGKSSLAATAARQYQSADNQYIDISCAPDSTLTSLIANIAYQATNISRLKETENHRRRYFGLRYLNFESGTSEKGRHLQEEIRTLTDAVEVLRELSTIHSEKPIVVLDEFDRIRSSEERNLFADLLKQLGDKKVPIKFIFTGVAESLDELLGTHGSAIRQLETITLPKMSWDARWSIALNAAKRFGVEISRDMCVRIAAISDGYPYYVHLITEKLLWQIFDDPLLVTKATKQHYQLALRDAIESISAELKRPYEMAINQKSGDYEAVLWSTADADFLHQYLKNMYSSYEYIVKQMEAAPVLDYEKYVQRIRKLKNPGCGSILISQERPGLYAYRENMLRGYVRMQAEAHGIELQGEEAKSTTKQYMHVPARTSTGYQQTTIPKGVHFHRKRST